MATAPTPSSSERYCAWYGTADAGVLYFGQAPFWSAMRAAEGDPQADLAQPGPQLVGRFDLEREVLLPPLQVGRGGEHSGVWDVLALAGRVYFTTFYEAAGSVDPETGSVRHFKDLGGGLNEWAIGPEGSALVTRYGSGSDDAGDGEALAIDAHGNVVARWPLQPPDGYTMAPKTPAWDPRRELLWVTTDLLPIDDPEAPDRHDAYAVARDGRVAERIAEPELHFVATGPGGNLYFAEVEGSELSLRVEPASGEEQRLVLDTNFVAALDFVQDIQPNADGRVVVTRWSGFVHVLYPDGRVGTTQLPRLDPSGLYYTGVVHGERLCATYCADVSVICVDAP